MTGFMKTVSIPWIKSPIFTLNSRLLEALKSLQANFKKSKTEKEEQEKVDKMALRKKRTTIPFNLCIVYLNLETKISIVALF